MKQKGKSILAGDYTLKMNLRRRSEEMTYPIELFIFIFLINRAIKR